MTVSNTTRRTSAVGAGAALAVPYSFPTLASGDLTVIQRVTSTGVETELVENASSAGYTATYGSTGGTVTTTDSIASTDEIHVIRITPITQSLNLTTGGSFNAENIMAALDKEAKINIEQGDDTSRTLTFPQTDDGDLNTELPNSVDRASTWLYFGTDGAPTTASSVTPNTATVSGFGVSLIDDNNAAAARTTLLLPLVYMGDYSSFSNAISTIGATVTGLVISEAEAVGTDETVPSTLSLVFVRGGSLTVAANKTVTINGPIEAGLYQIFDTSASSAVVTIGAWPDSRPIKELYTEWWGAVADNSTDCTAAFQAAADQDNIPIKLLAGIYVIDGDIDIQGKFFLEGHARSLTKVILANGVNNDMFVNDDSAAHHYFRNLSLDGNRANNLTSGNGIVSNSNTDIRIENCQIDSFRDSGLVIGNNTNRTNIFGCSFNTSNKGIESEAGGYGAIAINIYGTTFDSNVSAEIDLAYAQAFNIRGNYFEGLSGSTATGILCGGGCRHGSIENNYFKDYAIAIRVAAGTRNVEIGHQFYNTDDGTGIASYITMDASSYGNNVKFWDSVNMTDNGANAHGTSERVSYVNIPATSASESLQIPIFLMLEKGNIEQVTIIPASAITGQNTDYSSFKIWQGGTQLGATVDFTSGTDWATRSVNRILTSKTGAREKDDVIFFNKAVTANGLASPELLIVVEASY